MGKKRTKSPASKKIKVEVKEIVSEEPKILLADDDSSSEEEAEIQNQSISTEEGESPQKEHGEDIEDESNDELEEGEGDDVEMTGKIETIEPFTSTLVKPAFKSDGRYHNKQRCLLLCSRGVTSRFRHLLEDLRTLIPHHKKDSKLDVSKNQAGGIGAAVNEIAEMRGCNSVLFIECRKRQDAYLWIGHTGTGTASSRAAGPSAKFLIENIHTMDELRLTGNCMKGSRPLLSFDDNFDTRHELKLLKCLLIDMFGTPRGHPKSKPFVDRVMGFYYADGKVSEF